MGLFSFLGNLGAGIQGHRMGKKQMQLGQGMIDEAQALSAAYDRPEMMTPQAIQTMMDISRGMQFENMPGLTTMQNQIDKATAGGVSAIERMSKGSEGIGAIADLYASQMDQQANLGVQNAQFMRGAKEGYLSDLQTLGDWQQTAWQWNEADPYMQAQQKAAALETMGRQGEWEGLKNKMGSWAASFQGMGGALDETASQLGAALTGPWGTALSIMGGAGS